MPISNRFLSIIAVENGFAVYTQIPGYNVNTGMKSVPDWVFPTQLQLGEWIARMWSPDSVGAQKS